MKKKQNSCMLKMLNKTPISLEAMGILSVELLAKYVVIRRHILKKF